MRSVQPSKRHLQNKLHYAIRLAVRHDSSRCRGALRLAACRAEVRGENAGGAHASRAQLPEIGVIESVERLGAECEFESLGSVEALRESAIHIPETRPLEHIASHSGA